MDIFRAESNAEGAGSEYWRPGSFPRLEQLRPTMEAITAEFAAACPTLRVVLWDMGYEFGGDWRADIFKLDSDPESTKTGESAEVHMDMANFHAFVPGDI